MLVIWILNKIWIDSYEIRILIVNTSLLYKRATIWWINPLYSPTNFTFFLPTPTNFTDSSSPHDMAAATMAGGWGQWPNTAIHYIQKPVNMTHKFSSVPFIDTFAANIVKYRVCKTYMACIVIELVEIIHNSKVTCQRKNI